MTMAGNTYKIQFLHGPTNFATAKVLCEVCVEMNIQDNPHGSIVPIPVDAPLIPANHKLWARFMSAADGGQEFVYFMIGAETFGFAAPTDPSAGP
jgi:hypothetical protein